VFLPIFYFDLCFCRFFLLLVYYYKMGQVFSMKKAGSAILQNLPKSTY